MSTFESPQIEEWITILTAEYIHDAHLIKAQLELESIEVRILDELTAQTAPFYSQAIGGIRLQVKREFEERAKNYLIELGHLKKKQELKENKFISRFNQITAKIPFLKNFRMEVNVLIVISWFALVFIVPFVISNTPSLSDKITEKEWCIDRILYKGEELQLEEQLIRLIVMGCPNSFRLLRNGNVSMPDYKNVTAPVEWRVYENSIYIDNTINPTDQAEDDVFEGKFIVDYDGNDLTLTSTTTTIVAHNNRFTY